MTPFGEHMRFLRIKHNKTLQQQANRLCVSVAYLSALEHGRKGRPSPALIDQICVWLGLIWDEAEQIKRLALISHPKPVINATHLGPKAIALFYRRLLVTLSPYGLFLRDLSNSRLQLIVREVKKEEPIG